MKTRDDKFTQARRNESEERAIRGAIEECVPYAPRQIEFKNDLVLRTERDDEPVFRAKGLRRAEHFPYLVPELVSDDGDYILITWLTFGSLLRLLNEIQ